MKIHAMGIEHIHDGDFKIDRPNWNINYLFLHIRTPAIFVLQEKEIIVQQNSVILYHINTPQLYYAKEDVYSDDFIHFSMENDYNFFELINFPFNTIIQLQNSKNLDQLLKRIYLEYISFNGKKDITIDLLLKLMFTKISEQLNTVKTIHSNNEYFDLLSRLHTDIYLHPERDWSVHEIAKYTNLSMSYIQYLFKQFFGVPCMNTVIHSRIERAKSLLTTSNWSVKKIASLCGYNNDIAFMRQFKKITEKTPSEFRLENNNNNEKG